MAMDGDEKLKLVEHNYVMNELFNLTAGTNVASTSGNKQYKWTPRRKKYVVPGELKTRSNPESLMQRLDV